MTADLNSSFLAHLPFWENSQNLSRKYFCLCTWMLHPWVQVYFQKNKQICPNEVSKELNRTVWDLDECLGPICFAFRSLGSVLQGSFWWLPHLFSLFSSGLGQKRMSYVGSPVNWLRSHPCLHILAAKATQAERTWTLKGNNMVQSGFENQEAHLPSP